MEKSLEEVKKNEAIEDGHSKIKVYIHSIVKGFIFP